MDGWPGLVLDHLWQSTWVAVALVALVLMLGRFEARVRYWIWLAAAAKLLVPWAALAALGSAMNVWSPIDAPPSRPMAAIVVDVVAQPFTQQRFDVPIESAAPASRWVGLLPPALLAVWAVGVLVLGARWARRKMALRRVLRDASYAEEGREAALLHRLLGEDGRAGEVRLALTDAPFGPGTAGGFEPVIVWPRAMSGRLSDGEISAVLAHEIAHVRRSDGLTAAIVRAAETLFWFHPLVWWVRKRLDRDREQACDEAVLERGVAADVYAEALIKTCQFHLAAPLTCGVGRGGAELTSRVERVLWPPRRRTLSSGAAAVLLLLGAASIAAPVVAAASMPPRSLGMGPNQFFQAARLLVAWAPRSASAVPVGDARFRSIAIEPSTSPRGGLQTLAGGRLTGTGVTPFQILRVAYGPFKELPIYAVAGLPAWAKTERFDIRARAEHEFVNGASGEPVYLTALLQRLLADEFGLVAHREVRSMPVYALRVTGAARPGLRPTTSDCWRAGEHPVPAVPIAPSRWCRSALLGGGRTEAASLAWLANVLSVQPSIGRPVIDHTGLQGFYDMDWTPLAPGESIASRLETQLGLRLEPGEEPVEVLVVDRIARPRAR